MFTGNKYDSNLNTTEIAKLFRADVKAAVRAGEIAKGVKLSIRTDYFSGGSAIRVKIVAAPFGMVNPAGVASVIADVRCGVPHLTADGAALVANLSSMLDAYNRKDIDSQTDYFNVRFWGSVDVCWELERDETAMIRDGFAVLGLDPEQEAYRAAA